jgi:CHAT domain-containing protein
VAFSPERVAELSKEVVSILHRGNRSHKLTEANLEQLRLVGEELARKLLPQPVLSDIRRTMGVLTLELDETLLSFPWELFYDGEQFLCRRFDLGRIVRTSRPPRAVVQRSSASPPLRLLIVCADPSGDLPQVEREGLEIVSQLDGNPTLLARMVTEADLKFARRELKDHDFVHFAGHAEPAQKATDYGWRLDDGLLIGREIADMGAGRPMPSLVFSNACRSAAFTESNGDGQVFGLAQAFLTAGVRHYVGTQWEMVDGQGAQFARHLYTDLSRGASVGAAVRNARNRVIAESGEGQLAWASYVLYGDPEHIPLPVGETPEAPSAEPSPLRLGVRATAPFKPRAHFDAAASSTGALPGVSESTASGQRNGVGALPPRPRQTFIVVLATVALLSLLVSSSLAILFLLDKWKSDAHPKETPQTAPLHDKITQNGGRPRSVNAKDKTTGETHMKGRVSIHITRSGKKPGPRVRDGLAVLEACLLDGLSRRKGVVVMQKPLGKDNEAAKPTHLLTLSGHTVAGQVVMTAKLTAARLKKRVSSSVIKADTKLLTSCRTLAEKIISDLKHPQRPDARPPRNESPRALSRRSSARP